MSDFSFLAVPNIEGMRFLRYLKIIGIVLLFGVCLFFVIYFWYTYYKNKQLLKQLHIFNHHNKEMEQELLLQRIRKSSGKELVVLFIDYLERFVTNSHYANLTELLISQWFTLKEAEEFTEIVYADRKLSKQLEDEIMKTIRNMLEK